MNGGFAGAPNRYTVRRDGKTIEPGDFPGKIANFRLKPHDVLVMQSSGGGGFGDPTERSRDALALGPGRRIRDRSRPGRL